MTPQLCSAAWGREAAHTDGMQGEKKVGGHPVPGSSAARMCEGQLCLDARFSGGGQLPSSGGTCPSVFRGAKLSPPLMPSPCRKPSEYIAAIVELSALVSKRNQQIFLHTDFLYYLSPDGQRFRRACRVVHNFTDAVIQERRRTLPSEGADEFLQAKAKAKTLDFIDVLLLSKVGFSGT